MCELLGMSFNIPVGFQFSFRGFSHRGDKNRDGWGIAQYPDGGKAVQILKAPKMASSSELAKYVQQSSLVRSKTIISHVRYATSNVLYANTHPFTRELYGYDYSFAHNGSLSMYKTLDLVKYNPVGSTDSEWAFCYVLQRMLDADLGRMWDKDSFSELERIFQDINGLGKFNCIMATDEYLFCYRDRQGYKGLTMTRRTPPYNQDVKLLDEDWEINLIDEKRDAEKGVIVATSPITDEYWKPMKSNALTVYHLGKQVYPLPEERSRNDLLLETLSILRLSSHAVPVRDIQHLLSGTVLSPETILSPCIEAEFITRHSRYGENAFSPDSRYFTAPDKREQIDQMLKQSGLYHDHMAR